MALGYVVRRSPFGREAVWPEKQAVVPPPLTQWLVDADAMLTKVAAELPLMQPGVVKQLMAGTAAGKTTKLPPHLAIELETVILVLVPEVGQARSVANYVSRISVGTRLEGKIFELTSSPMKTTVTPAVYYAATGDFLALLCAKPHLMTWMGVTVIIVDESHSIRPEYSILRKLIAVGALGNVKLLFASATAASDVSKEDGARRQMVSFEPGPSSPDKSMDKNNPGHYSRIRNRTMCFVANDVEARAWYRYYVDHDVPSYIFGYASRGSSLEPLVKFLAENMVCAVLTTSILETSYTFNIDVVIDHGYTSRPQWDTASGIIHVLRIPVTKSQKVQRAGRVGRIVPGIAYSAEISTSQEVSPDDPEIAAYTYLWSRMFNLQIRDPVVSVFHSLFGSLTREVIGFMLTCALPPLVTLSYLDDGGVYAGWPAGFRPLVTTKDTPPTSDRSNTDRVIDWKIRVLPPVTDGDEGMREYKSRMELHYPYNVLAMHLWEAYDAGDDFDDAVSVAVTVHNGMSLQRSTRKKGRKSQAIPPVPEIPAEHRVTRAITQYTAANTIVVPRREKPSEVFQRAESSRASTVIRPVKQPYHAPVFDDEIEEEPQVVDVARIEKWVDGSIRRNTNSSSGSSKRDKKIRKVSAKKHWRDTLYPFEERLLTEFLQNSAVTSKDKKRVNDLLNHKVQYGSLSPHTTSLIDKQEAYFLSILRVHNFALVRLLQRMVDKKPTIFESLFNSNTASESIETYAHDTALLLVMCEHVGHYVGVDANKKHSGFDPVEEHVSARAIAEQALQMGPQSVVTKIARMMDSAAPISGVDEYGGCVKGQGWAMNGRQFCALHVWSSVPARIQSTWLIDAGQVLDLDDDVFVCEMETDTLVDWRLPTDGEFVYVVIADVARSKMRVYGFNVIYVSRTCVYMAGVMSAGFSGALVVAANDGCVVGMYVGEHMRVHGKPYSRCVSVEKILC